jgi:hypothetical protein
MQGRAEGHCRGELRDIAGTSPRPGDEEKALVEGSGACGTQICTQGPKLIIN